MNAKIEKGVLTITIPVNPEPKPSSSGKSLVIASTGGNIVTNCLVGGKPLIIGLNAYTKN
jgi:hypothetical protein